MLEGEFSFWLRNQTKSYAASVTAYPCSYDGSSYIIDTDHPIGSKTIPKPSSTPSFQKINFTSETSTRVALLISRAYFDDFTYTPGTVSQDPILKVTGYANGSSYDFGGKPVEEDTPQTFTIVNGGGSLLTVNSINVTGDYRLSEIDTPFDLEPNAAQDITVYTPAKDSNGVLKIESNDSDGDYIINLSSTFKVPVPIMGITPVSMDFGKVVSDVTRTVKVTNTGDADLVAKAVSNSESFIVTEEEIIVKPKEESELAITFHFDEENPGIYTGVITVTPNVGEPVEITVTAKATDPNLWEEDFEDGEIPEGWETIGWKVQKGGYGNNGTFMAYAGTTKGNTLTTPRLYAKKGEALTFEIGGGTDGTDKLTIEYSHDRNEWTAIDGSPFSSTGEKSFVSPEDGYYYLRFQGQYAMLDNFSGFKLAPKTHDISVTAYNLPSTANQYLDYTASVTLKETKGNNEELELVLYLDDEEVATEDAVNLDAGEEKQISISFTPETAVEAASIKLVVKYADEELVAAQGNLTVKAALVYDEDTVVDFETGRKDVIHFNYKPVEGWNTFAAPFEATDEILTQIFGPDYRAYEIDGYYDNCINFKETSRFAAGYPYLIYTPDTEKAAEKVIISDVTILRTTGQSDVKTHVEFQATLTPLSAEELAGCHLFSAPVASYAMDTDNSFDVPVVKASGDDDALKAYRGYLKLSETAAASPIVRLYNNDGTVTSIDRTEMEKSGVELIFDLNGIPVKKPVSKGIYIIDGKKVIIR